MVAVVTGNGLGLFNTSLNILGAAGSFGQGNLGQAGGKAWVNASTGNLILRFTDEQLSGQGQDLFHTRTYNTLGALNDADGDGWRWDGERRVVLAGTALSAGSSLTRTTGDGHETVYTWNGSRYQSTDGDGAHDFIQWDGQNNEWYWTDGTTRSVERYNGSSGLLVSLRDTQGTLITYGYHNGKLSSVTDSSGQALLMVYNDAGQMIRLDTRSSANGPLTSQVYYVYDDYGRLLEVKTDLTPDDNSIADGQYYFTRYTYDGSSFRVATVEQSDRTSASFTYERVDGQYRVKTVNDASGLTTFTYVPSQRYTKVSNALNQEWVYTYDAKGQLTYVQSPAENGQSFYTGYQYDADGNVTRVTDNSGNAVSYFYDARGNRILERDPKGVTVARTFNAANQLLSEIHYSQPATWYGASGTWGEPPASSAQVTRYVYDYAERLRFVVSATGGVVEYTYEARGLRAQEIVHGAGRYPVAGLAPNTTLDESALAAWSAAQDHGKTRLTAFNYDYRGNLILRVAYANVDSNGNWLLDSAAELTRYVYNEQGQLLQTLAGRGADRSTQVLLSSTAYDGMGRVIAQMDASGTRTTLYDDQQRRIAVTTASGLILTQVYDPQGRLLRIEESTTAGNARGNTEYAYDAAGRLIMKKDATGVRTYTFYDALGRVAADVDGTGSITRYGYNQKDQRISALSYATQVDTRAWFNNGVVSVTLAQILPAASAADRLTRLDYDEAGRLLNSVDAVGTVTSYEYDGRGQLVRQATGQRVTRFFFDADGRQVGQLDAEGYLRENVYNAAGQLQQVIRYAAATTVGMRATGSLTDLRPNGASLSTWSFYDGAGRQIGSVDEQGFVSETVYNEAGNASQSIRYLNAYTATLSAGTSFATVRATAVVGGSEATITVYDALGRLSRRVMVDGTVTTFEYDAAGRLVKETTAAGTADERSTRTLYDAYGQTTGKLLGEASSRITAGMSQAQIAAVYSQYGSTWNYDAAGRVASVTDALGSRTVSYYDAAGRLTRVINAVGEVSETKYNAFGEAIENNQLSNRVATGTLPGLAGGLQNSGLESLLAAIRNANNDSRTSATYDTRGLLLTSIDAEGISTTNQYDAYGQLQRQIRVIAGSRTVTSAYGYNLRGERISQTRDAGGLNLTDTTAYDAFGRVIRSIDAAGNVTSSEYQNNGRTVVVRDPLNNSRHTELDAFGRTLKSVDALGNVTTYSYDDINRSVVVTMPDGTQVSTWKTRHGETLKVVNGKGDVTQYEYNRDGQLIRTVDALGQAEVKRYDRAGRLSESVDARGIVTHLDYDAANRVVQRSVDPTGLNQRTTYEFDTSGRQIRVVDAAGTSSARVTENRYDRKGQLLQTIVDPNGLQLSTRYSYDGLGNVLRVSQGTVGSPEQRVTDYVYDALGQRRFSIDALGYVSERTYDTTGNVIQETRYANKLQNRDPATLQGLGVNRLDNVEFASGGNGLAEGWRSVTHEATGSYLVGATQAPADVPAGDNVVQLYQGGSNQNPVGYMELHKNVFGIQGGHRYSFSVYTGAQGATGFIYLYWLDAAGKVIDPIPGTPRTPANQNASEAPGGASLADYKRLVATGVAPADAVGAILVIAKQNAAAGVEGSQLLALHPQFEEIPAGGVDASPWTRPLQTSPDDRVTSYTYDALGRQRFSVDALGYVSERRYDAAGHVVEEVRYANKLQGARDATTLQRLGVNRLDNVEFASGGNGLAEGWRSVTHEATGSYLVGATQAPADVPAGDNVVQLYQGGSNQNPVGYMELHKNVFGIQGGHRYSFSVYTGAQGATGFIYLYWLDAAGKVIDPIPGTPRTPANQNASEAPGGTSLADYKRLVATGVAPADAVGAILVIAKQNAAAGVEGSQLLALHPQFEEIPAGGVDASPWTRSLQASPDDRVTSYTYDALGRQRFSVDALGYVSERRYDAAGHVVEEVRYANKLQGARDATTLQRLGVNRLDNVEFASGGNGLAEGWRSVTHEATGSYLVGATQAPADVPAGDNVVQLYQGGSNQNPVGYMELHKNVSGIQAGHRYSFSVYTGAQGATGFIYLYWLDAAGKVIDPIPGTPRTPANQNASEAPGGTSLADYKRLVATGVAPADAVGAILVIAKQNAAAGVEGSQLLALHPQFEEILAGGVDASPWTRSLQTSPDDRVTNYVYDALGRQRFSVDALGYVSERRYDAAGHVVEEVRYANKLQGARDATTLQGLGVNRLDNVEFASGGNGLAEGWRSVTHEATGSYLVGATQAPADVPAGDNVVQLYQGGSNQNPVGDMELHKNVSGIQAGHRYSFSVYTGAQGATGFIYLYWLDAAGKVIDPIPGTPRTPANQNASEAPGGTSLADYKRLVATGVAPADAVGAILVIAKQNAAAGVEGSQVLALHPQFEEILAGGVDASPWTRSLQTSPDDRVTSYTYDALGRQRFSVDALGYVSERRYDAAGHVVEEVRYANKLQGARDATTLQGLGVNRLDNVEFASGGNGLAAGWRSNTYQATGTYQVGGALTPGDVPAGDNVVQLYQGGRTENPLGYMEVHKNVSGIQAGHRYSFSVYIGAQGATGFIYLYWLDAAGKVIDPIPGTPRTPANQNASEAPGGTSLADYKRLVSTGVAPEGAVGAILVIGKQNALPGVEGSQVLALHPQFEEVSAGGNDASPWSRSLVNSVNDRVTRYVYDPAGQLKSATDPLGYTESYTYDAFGNRTSLTNKNGQTWNYGYDRLGQLTEEITPPIWVSKMDAAGNGSGQSALLVTRNEYNAFGNITSRSEGRLRSSLIADPAVDDLTQSRTAAYGYDALGRQVRITSPGWYNKTTGQFQQGSDGTANTFQVTTDVTYDDLGNAVRNRVQVNNSGVAGFDFVDSYKAYDLLGQVRYEVDALKGVTVHEYDGFGQETLTRRHAAALTAGVPASGYYQPADFTAATLPRDAVNDRTLATTYDLLGRKTEVQQDVVNLYSFTGNVATSALKSVAPVKTFGYNSFGEITRETLLARDINGASVMEQISTVNYYDRVGQRIGTVDALGYYTRLEYTGSGKVSRQVEYANALGAWSEASIPAAQASGKDRSVRFTYDKADRLLQTTQENVTYWQQSLVPNGARATMTQVTGDVIVSRSSYDGVGNVRTLTDAAGNVTTTEYNALGQVYRVTEPGRYTARSGSANPFDNPVYAAPVVDYAVNAFGQVVLEIRSAGAGQAGVTQSTRTVYDAAGHEVKEFDAMSSAQNFKVDVAGRRLEESREIYSELTGWRYNSQTLRRTFTYDSLGQQLGATDWYTDAGVQKSTSNTVVYNRFGEVSAELLNGNAKSSYLYNQIGNAIQQTNAQGVTQVDYDLTGKASRSAQLGNLSTSADDRITYLRNDLLGRVLEQHLPAFEANVSVDTLNSVSLALTTPIIRQASDRWGNVLSRTDARGYVTSYSYDHNNQVLSETLPETDILRENGTSYRASLIHEKRYDLRGLLVEEADWVSTGGGPLRTRQHVYNAAGQLVRDIDALSASRYYAVDAHGNQLGTYDPLGNATFDEYDAMDRHTAHGVVRNGQRVTLLTNQYDQAGRLYAEISGTAKVTETLSATEKTDKTSTVNGVAGNTRFTVFDERGNIVQTRTESNILKSFVFNEANRKVAEIDGLGGSLTWNYNEGDYGRLATHKDLGNRNFSYTYNAFGQMLTDNSDKSYAYYGNGLLKSVTVTVSGTQGIQEEFRYRTDEWRSVTTSSYLYDLAGNKVSETLASRITSTAPNANLFITSQETRYRFDEQGRLANAREFAGNMGLGAGVFTYNRIKVGKDSYMYSPTFHYGINTTADISLSYRFDEFGNRRQARMVTTSPSNINTVVDNWFKYDINDQAVVVDGFLENGAVVAGTQAGQAKGYTISYDAAGRRASSEQWSGKTATQENYERSEYIYNALGQVTSRSVRAITRQAGASSAGAVQSIGADQVNLSNSYDERGRIVIQATYQGGVAQTYVESAYRGDNQKLSELSYTYSNSLRKLSQATYFGEAGMLDAAGNQTRYRYVAYNTSGGITQSGDYRTTYSGYESYKASSLVATTSLSGYTAGTTGYVYTDRGDLLHLNTNGANGTRRFAYNGEGQIVGRWENIGVVQNYIYYQNAELANAGNASAPTIADTFSAISADYPGHAPSSYQVNQGDTFQSIAQSVWGDSRMWYLIADANGKDASSPLVAGTSLRIPNVVGSTHNDSTTFKPFNASEVIGNTVTAPQPPKPKKKKCNAVASIVMVVVAVVVSYFVPGLGGVFLGSLASQTAGKAMGVVDHISLKQAAVTTFTAGVASIAAPAISGATSGIANETVRTTINYAAQGAVVYASNYVGSKVVGLETSFSWKGMAASAIGSAVAGNLYSDDGLMGSVVRGQVSAHTSAWMRDKWFGGGRPDYGQVAADAFGNALADYMVGKFKASIESVNPKDFLDDKALRASNTTFAPGVASAEGSAVDAELVAKLRDLGWFDLSSSLTDEEYSGLKYSGPLDQKTPAWLSGAFNYLDRSKSADQALLTKKVEEATGFFGTSAAINTRVMNAIYYEFAEAGLAVVALGASQAVRDEVANKLGYVVNHPIEAVSTKAEKLWAEWNDTPATQVMEDTYRFGASTLLTLGVGKMAFSGVREAADAASSVLTRRLASRETLVEINRSDLGELLGRGGNKDVFAYGDSQAIGVLRVRDPQLLMDELKMLNQLEDLGLPTVNARGPISVSGQLGLMFDRFAQGSKSVVRLEESKVRIVGGSTLLNDQSIADLQGVRRVMVENNIQIDDLQFLISERGRVVIADPLGVNLNKPPSRNNLRMIDLLIKVAEGNKKL